MAFHKVHLLRLLCFIVFCIGATQGDENNKLTRATKSQRVDIEALIEKWDEGSVVKNDNISTYATFPIQRRGEKSKTGLTYRLDNERSTATHAKFRIQSGKETYGVVLVRIGVNHGKITIRQALTESVKDMKTVTI